MATAEVRGVGRGQGWESVVLLVALVWECGRRLHALISRWTVPPQRGQSLRRSRPPSHRVIDANPETGLPEYRVFPYENLALEPFRGLECLLPVVSRMRALQS